MKNREGQDWITFMALCLFALLVAYASAETQTMQTVAKVDITRYMGSWREIARYPNRFEEKCDADVTAEYSLRDDGRVQVVNRCRRADGSMKVAKGWAKVVDRESNAKLKVTFFWPFFGNYWILDLGEGYEYAVVGEPSRKYLWVLAREPELDAKTYAKICERLRAQGYDPQKLILTKRSN